MKASVGAPIVQRVGRQLYIATCECGWTAKRSSEKAAMRAATDHWESRHAAAAVPEARLA